VRVRVVRKSQGASGVAGVEDVTADVSDPAQVARITEGASVAYHCVNPPYHQWKDLLLPMTRGLVAGLTKTQTRLVALDNVYMYGDTSKMSERTVVAPRSQKGELRAEAASWMLDADRRGDLLVCVARAADFFGPNTPLGSIFGERFYQRVLSGKSGECFGDPDQLHSYSYTPDVAAGMVALGMSTATRGVYMLPVQPAESTRHVMGRFFRALENDPGVSRVPTWVLRAMGIFNPIVRELPEMVYQWEQPYVLDDSRIRAELGVVPTPWDDAVAMTLSWAKRVYGRDALRHNVA
jgi:nucleoside-diphosphate-sugar epimerase